MTESVLVVEDDNDIARLIGLHVNELSLQAELLPSGQNVIDKVLANNYALVILDVMLPDVSGLDLCRQIREKKPAQLVMMLTSRDSEADRVVGLELGADDYMAKPFSIRELQARIRAQVRRFRILNSQTQTNNDKSLIKLGKLEIDNLCHKATLAAANLTLTSTEFELLSFLATHPDQVFSREQLLSQVWGYHHTGYEHTVNSHINRLRNKLESKPTKPEIVQTVWGVGYKLNSQGVN